MAKKPWYMKKTAQADFYKIDWEAIGGAIISGLVLLGILAAVIANAG